MKLSVLKNATSDYTTYYVGDDFFHISHLKNGTLFTKKFFEGLDNVKQIIVDDPQLEFYKLSNLVPNEFTFNGRYQIGTNCEIHQTCVIGDDVVIGNNVKIGPNTVVYSKTIIGDNTSIGANTTIGCEGMMWVWSNDEKVFLKLLGGVIIESDCVIGSNCSIVRGSANENTIIQTQVNLAPGCNIGHGTFIGAKTHLANNVSTGGSSYISKKCFLGSGVIVSAGIKIESTNVILGAGSVVVKDLSIDGVYYGNPAQKRNEIQPKLSGIPKWI